MHKTVLAVVLALAGTATTLATGVSPAGSLAGCSVAWGSLPKQAAPLSTAPLVGARAGQHACYDRFVVDIRGTVPGFKASYVAQATEDGSGKPIPLRGGAFIQFVVHSPAYDINTGQSTYQPANRSEVVNVAGFRTLRQVAWGGSFEGYSTFGVGVRARVPFRVSTWQSSPSSGVLVVDVAHGW